MQAAVRSRDKASGQEHAGNNMKERLKRVLYMGSGPCMPAHAPSLHRNPASNRLMRW